MDHLAIMNPKLKLIERILNKEKTIESRWYKTKRAPWNSISEDDTVYFKDAGKKVTACAKVEKIIQIDHLDIPRANELIQLYGKDICIQNHDVEKWAQGKNFAILIFLKDVHKIKEPFDIDKKGFGIGCAWLCIENVQTIKK